MSKEYENFWVQMEGKEGWDKAKDDIKGLVTDPMLWATNLIESATQHRADAPGIIGVNEKAWQQVKVALDVLKWLNEQ